MSSGEPRYFNDRHAIFSIVLIVVGVIVGTHLHDVIARSGPCESANMRDRPTFVIGSFTEYYIDIAVGGTAVCTSDWKTAK